MKTAIILGATSGVGYSVAATSELAKTHTVHGFHRGHYPENVKELRRLGVRCHQADAGTSYEDVNTAVELAVLEVQPYSVDVVVHSLAGASVGPTLEASYESVEKTFNRLAHSYLWWVQQLVHTNLLASSCRFIALTNPCSTYYIRNGGVIGAAKAALEGYVRLLAAELAPLGHRSNAISFGAIETPALAKVIQSGQLAGVTPPAGRLQTAQDVAAMIVMLATSPHCAGMNGATVDFTAAVPLMFMDRAFHGATK